MCACRERQTETKKCEGEMMRRMAGGAKERACASQMDPEGSRLSAEKVVERRERKAKGDGGRARE